MPRRVFEVLSVVYVVGLFLWATWPMLRYYHEKWREHD